MTTTTPATVTKTYIIDNGRSYSDHEVFFVEADPAQFDPLWAVYEKAWPQFDSCPRCGALASDEPYCLTSLACRFRVIAVVDLLTWRDISVKMSLTEWLEQNDSFDNFTHDVAAADEFKQRGRLLYPDFLDWMGPFKLRSHL